MTENIQFILYLKNFHYSYLKSSLHRVYRVMNFLAKSLASINPSATNIISHIKAKSGTTIAQGLNSAFKFSGSSVRPAYPGFIVMNSPIYK